MVSLVNGRPSANNFSNADVLQEWTKATDVRLRLIRTKTLLGHLMAVARQDPTVTRRVSIPLYHQYLYGPYLYPLSSLITVARQDLIFLIYVIMSTFTLCMTSILVKSNIVSVCV